ncbi:protein disulfide-isomerase 2, partial [Rhipicephalus microplus]|uniref:protein disulfide-isomerase 2 n=1 Tax=Rhipicephalus microplus TaxID=6941 RepID=UPI003F6D76E2
MPTAFTDAFQVRSVAAGCSSIAHGLQLKILRLRNAQGLLDILAYDVRYGFHNINDLLSGPIRQYSLLFYSKNSANMTEAQKNFREAAASFRHKVVFVTINVDKEEIELILMYFRIWQDNVPALRFAEYDGVGSVTPFMPETDSLKTEDINTFVEGVLNGSIKDTPWLPDSFNSTIHRAKVVVQENFDEVVFDKTKDVLVLFYSPWCTPCYHLTLHYDWLANMYNDHEDLLIVKMDATMNELEHTDIHSFPTLRLYKKQNNEVVEYNG